jgi:hypothetical protein
MGDKVQSGVQNFTASLLQRNVIGEQYLFELLIDSKGITL